MYELKEIPGYNNNFSENVLMDYPVEKAEIAIFLPHYQNSGVILWKMEASFLGGAGLFRTKQTLIITPTFQANTVPISHLPLLPSSQSQPVIHCFRSLVFFETIGQTHIPSRMLSQHTLLW